jgi:hypothetical protein
MGSNSGMRPEPYRMGTLCSTCLGRNQVLVRKACLSLGFTLTFEWQVCAAPSIKDRLYVASAISILNPLDPKARSPSGSVQTRIEPNERATLQKSIVDLGQNSGRYRSIRYVD